MSSHSADVSFATRPPNATPIRRLLRFGKRLVMSLLAALAFYLLIVVVGLIPVNNDFVPAEDGITVYIVSSEVHADVVLPLQVAGVDWRQSFPPSMFAADTSQASHVAIGWGDKGFYRETPTWADLKAHTVAHALLLPSDACIHVSMTRSNYLGENAREVCITREQYLELVAFIESSFALTAKGDKQRIPGVAYGGYDVFFEAVGSYNCFNTCNAWTGRAMQHAGMRTPWLSLLPKTPYMYLPR